MKRTVGTTRTTRRRGIALALLFASQGAIAQAPQGAPLVVDEPRLKAAFVYNFLKFVEWPQSSFTGPRTPLVVGIVGDAATATATAEFLRGKQIALTHSGPSPSRVGLQDSRIVRPLEVRRLALDDSLNGIHALYIAETDEVRIRRLLDAAGRRPILSIGDSERFAALGGIIGLVVEQQKVRFEVNVGAATHSRLKISSKLLALAKEVHLEREPVSK